MTLERKWKAGMLSFLLWSLGQCYLLPWFLLDVWSGLIHEPIFTALSGNADSACVQLGKSSRSVIWYLTDVLPTPALMVLSTALDTEWVHAQCSGPLCHTSQTITWLFLRIFCIPWVIRGKISTSKLPSPDPFALPRLPPKIVQRSHKVISYQRP